MKNKVGAVGEVSNHFREPFDCQVWSGKLCWPRLWFKGG